MVRHKMLALLFGAVAISACGPANRNGGGGGGGDGGSNNGPCVDEDGDGWTTCQGDCCDNTTQCSNPKLVNPGAYEVNGDGIDNDCDGHVDNAVLTCDNGVNGNSTSGYDFAAAIDVCPTTNLQGSALMADPLRHWGIVDAQLTGADGTGTPNSMSMAILPHYGTGVKPQNGAKLMLMSTGYAAGEGDPHYDPTLSGIMFTLSGFPADYIAAHNGTLPNAPGCPAPGGNIANDPTMLTLKIRVPTNAQSFSMDVNFFSSEFPKWTCSSYNDFFVVLLDSTYAGTGSAANPADKNLAFYKNSAGSDYPVGVNLAYGNTGLFTECVNGTTGCSGGVGGSISTCTSTSELQGTGLEQAAAGLCDSNSLKGGGTGWLTTSGNVTPGEIMTLRIALWDTSDDALDSMAVIDNFKWSALTSQPGTVIQREAPHELHDPIYIPLHGATQNASQVE